MGVTDRSSVSIGGPRGGTTWADYGDSFTLQNHGTISATTSAPGLFAAYTVTRPNPFYQASESTAQSYQDFVNPATNTIQALYGMQVTSSVLQAPLSNLTLTINVYRAIGTLASTFVAGTVTSIPLASPLTQTIPNSSTITINHLASSTTTTLTLSAAAPIGATSIPITSTNLSSYAAGDVLSWQVGNNPAFGWIGGSGGTPLFPVGVSIVAPIVTANTSIVTGVSNGVQAGWGGYFGTTTAAQSGFIPLQQGDSLLVNTVTSSATATVQVLNIQPLIV